jgi:hypothetical protein
MYFGHPTNTYNTEMERMLIAKITRTFPECTVENPNQEHHLVLVKRNGAEYYLSEVILNCDIGIFLLFRDGTLDNDLFAQAKLFASRNNDPWVWTIDHQGETRLVHTNSVRVLSEKETRRRITQPY